jgi:A/G-specific adenine glycosylase
VQYNNYNNFSAILLQWHKTNERSLPWKNTKDPYLTWLSEIILQQTQIGQGVPYYQKISTKYPTVKHLADATLAEVIKLWEGLGYYSRARNLHHTAKYIAYEHGSRFPNTYDELLKLKGVGAYTAAAIASFAFDKPHAVVDGNVFRVLARIFGIKKSIDSTEGKKNFTQLANKLIDKKNPAAYNQAIMDFGSTVCTPKQPLCDLCPFSKKCIAKTTNSISYYPVKLKKLVKKTRYFNYLLIEYGKKIYLNHRTGNDIWKNLYDFPVIASKSLLSEKQFHNSKEWKIWFRGHKPHIKYISGNYVQQLTHQTVIARFCKVLIDRKLEDRYGFNLVQVSKIGTKAFPKIIRDYLKTISNFKY